MTFSLFLVLITIGCIILGYLRYKEWAKRETFYNKMNQSKEMMKMYDEYVSLITEYPELKEKLNFIEKLMRGEE